MLKISLVLCMVAFTTVGCAARQTKAPAFAKASAEEIITVKQDVVAIKIERADTTLVYQAAFKQPTTVVRHYACRPPQTTDTDQKMVECITWNTHGGWGKIYIHSDWIVIYTFASTISELAGN